MCPVHGALGTCEQEVILMGQEVILMGQEVILMGQEVILMGLTDFGYTMWVAAFKITINSH